MRYHIITANGIKSHFKEVKSLSGLKTGYQIYLAAKSITDFIKAIGLQDYVKYGYVLRYVLNNGQSPTDKNKTVYVAMLFQLGESYFE